VTIIGVLAVPCHVSTSAAHIPVLRAHLLGLSEDMPVRIEIVDRPDQIAMVLPVLDDLVQGGLIVLEDVHVVRYLHDPRS
jgi:PII-like signaling protein